MPDPVRSRQTAEAARRWRARPRPAAFGHFMVQLAVLRGCHIIALCGGAKKAAFAKSLGAHRVIDYRAESVAGALAVRAINRQGVGRLAMKAKELLF